MSKPIEYGDYYAALCTIGISAKKTHPTTVLAIPVQRQEGSQQKESTLPNGWNFRQGLGIIHIPDGMIVFDHNIACVIGLHNKLCVSGVERDIF